MEDELWGTWIMRLATLNGHDSIRTFLASAGISGAKWFPNDPLTQPEHFVQMAELCGSTTATFSRILTTLPYWECFFGDRANARLRALQLSGPRGIERGVGTSAKMLKLLRVCSECLAEDSDDLGAAYFHRQHQLPNTRLCLKHRTRLCDRCPRCALPLFSYITVQCLETICSCGFDLADQNPPPRTLDDDPWYRLAQFEMHCLLAPPNALQAEAAVAYADQLLSQRRGLEGANFTKVLIQCFGQDGWRWIRSVTQRRESEQAPDPAHSFKAATRVGRLLPPIFVALNTDFSEAIAAVSSRPKENFGLSEFKAAPRTQKPRTDDLQEARRRVEEYFESPGRSPSKVVLFCRSEYWRLRIFDPNWLQKTLRTHAPLASMRALPTIHADRLSIEKATNKHQSSVALCRAWMRDREWANERNVALRKSATLAISDRIVERVKHARQRNESSAGKPVQFNIRRAAFLTGESAARISAHLASNPKLAEYVPEPNESYQRRLILWAIEECIGRELTLQRSTVIRMTGLTWSVSIAQVEQLLEQRSASQAAQAASK
ncbi:MAG: TniQ family protein [Burkholderiales bacterium]|nr:TniQ family protein [Burkholderiales bacterium]